MNELNQTKIGLVLTGGGAKGAYQVGVLKYLAEINFEPEIIAATSIGTLHGAVLASYSSLSEGVEHLEKIWTELEDIEIIKPNTSTVIKTLAYTTESLIPNFSRWAIQILEDLGILPDNNSIFDSTPLEKLVSENINFNQILQGTELWIKVFPAWKIPGIDYDLIFSLIDLFRSKFATKSEWLKLQDCKDIKTAYNLLLASAAIPLAFPQKAVNGKFYSDGSLDGQIPIEPLIKQGCTHIIIVHLNNASIFNRYDFPEQTIIEIRPQKLINNSNMLIMGNLSSIFDFSAKRIKELKHQGYQDAKKYLEDIIKAISIRWEQRIVQESLLNSTKQLLDDSSC